MHTDASVHHSVCSISPNTEKVLASNQIMTGNVHTSEKKSQMIELRRERLMLFGLRLQTSLLSLTTWCLGEFGIVES
jgi:hypothetical protein